MGKTNTNVGVGALDLLTLLFVYLKLTHKIDWSWWWVLAPIWVSASVALIILALVGIGYVIYKRVFDD